jgi:hypothetical protein
LCSPDPEVLMSTLPCPEVCDPLFLLCVTSSLTAHLQTLRDAREVCVYSISCKNQSNIDITLEWLTKHAKS